MSEIKPGEKVAKRSKQVDLIIQLSGGAIFGALSIAISAIITANPLLVPRVPQGLALFDAISIVWIISFLIFGPLAGMLSSVIGFIGLIPFDLSLPVIGPLMKFCATIPLIIVPTLLLRLYKRNEDGLNSQKLRNPKKYIIAGVIGLLVREVVMVILNIIVFLAFFGSQGLEAWLVLIIFINALQTLWDLGIPYAIVFGSNLPERLDIW